MSINIISREELDSRTVTNTMPDEALITIYTGIPRIPICAVKAYKTSWRAGGHCIEISAPIDLHPYYDEDDDTNEWTEDDERPAILDEEYERIAKAYGFKYSTFDERDPREMWIWKDEGPGARSAFTQEEEKS